MSKVQVQSEIMGDGSYGLRAKRDGGTMRVWFCGGMHAPWANVGNITQVSCAHSSQIKASECPNRPDA